MKQSLPSIIKIGYVPCSLLAPNILQKYLAGVPVGIFQIPTDVEHYGNAKCEAEQEYDNGSYSEKAVFALGTSVTLSQERTCSQVRGKFSELRFAERTGFEPAKRF